MTIQLVQPYYERRNVLQLAKNICDANAQEAVLVTVSNSRGFDAITVTV